jgi:hypothetical protein
VKPTAASDAPRRSVGSTLVQRSMDVWIACLIFSLVYLPMPSLVAGLVFSTDRFYHWDHFMMAPALAHLHGMALALDVYAPYGLGWPTLMSSLSGVLRLSHQNAIAFGAVYSGIYFSALYWLFRTAVGRRCLPLAGVLLSLWLGFFSPAFAQHAATQSNWQWPSMMLLRAPFDVFFFLALLVHARGGRALASVAAAALAGLSLFFETDTGLMIVGTFTIYWVGLLTFGASSRGGGDEEVPSEGAIVRPERIGPTLWSSLAALLVVMILGLVLATHGRFVSQPLGVLALWLGGLTNAVSVSARLFTEYVAEAPMSLPPILAGLGLCLYVVGDAAMTALHRRLGPMSWFLGCLGFYGAGRLVLFAWNSEPIRARFVGFSAAIILVVLFSRALGRLDVWAARSTTPHAARLVALAPLATLLGTAGLLLSSPTFRDYPNVWQLISAGPPAGGTFVLPDREEIWVTERIDRRIGLPLRAAADEIRRLSAEGNRVAVLDESKTFIYLESGTKPWRGDAAHFMNTWTLADAKERREDFRESGPPYVLMQRRPPRKKLTRDSWIAMRKSLHPRYRVAKELPFFDILWCESCRGPGD